ncbi:motility protein A [Clostridiaceae bacterium 14S0207]|nr:motility protein A [Clostridiaceae bacterium 14S0207]
MKKSDIATSIGLVIGIALMIWGMASGKASIAVFWDPASVGITVGGSFAALLITYPMDQIKALFKVFVQGFKNSAMAGTDIIEKFTNLSRKARREGLLSLEEEINSVENEFMKKGLQMVVDGIEPEVIKDIMELEISEVERRHGDNSSVLKTWAAFGPAFGMLGTLIGLIQMLANLSDQSGLASGMATALITTFYGSLLANLILTPMATNLDYKSSLEISNMEMMLEGILAIQSGVNPRIVEEKLTAYLSPQEKIVYKQTSGDGVTENV